MTPGQRSRRRRWPILALVVVLVAASGAVIWQLRPWAGSAEDPDAGSAEQSDIVTVPVERATLTEQLRLNATLGYGDPVQLGPASGVLTALPSPGAVIRAGERVYEADGRPVILLTGARPFWRDLTADIDDGPDVLQLEQNLARFGYFEEEPDERFDWYTSDAISRWQEDLGVEQTGALQVSDVVVVNAPSIRVSQVKASLGERGASPLTYTATTLHATAKLSAAQARELQAGTPVTVVLPDGTELENELAAVDPGGEQGEDDKATPPTATILFSDQRQVSEIGPAAVRVVVQRGEDAAETLVVPVTALIATAQDRYAVEVRTSEGTARVPVEIGLVADARAQIIASGPEVEGAPADARALKVGDDVVISR